LIHLKDNFLIILIKLKNAKQEFDPHTITRIDSTKFMPLVFVLVWCGGLTALKKTSILLVKEHYHLSKTMEEN
jgi:hypothetical protein